MYGAPAVRPLGQQEKAIINVKIIVSKTIASARWVTFHSAFIVT